MELTTKIDPDKQFNPTQKNIRALTAQYNLVLTGFQTIATGIENTTLVLHCHDGDYVLRVYRQDKKHDEHIHQEIDFVHFLHDQGIKVPRIIPNLAGTLLTKFQTEATTWQAILMEFIPGHHAPTYSTQLLDDMADIQARIHGLSGSFDNRYQGLELGELNKQPFIKHIDAQKLPDPRLLDFIERAKNYQVILDPSLPRGLCHLDYDKDNILVGKDGLVAAILDFDDLALAPYVVDLANTLWEITDCTNNSTADHYLQRYEQSRTLTLPEKSILSRAMLYRHYLVYTTWMSLGRLTDMRAANQCLAVEEALIKLGEQIG